MQFEELLAAVGDKVIFETGWLLVAGTNPADVRRGLCRWVEKGRLYQLRRGLYALAPPYQRVVPHPFVVANALVRGSYVSLQSALAFHGMIPESVHTVTSVTHRRGRRFTTPLGGFIFHNIHPRLLSGYVAEVIAGQDAFVARPEKALLDLLHLVPGTDDPAFLEELRLRLDSFDLGLFESWAEGRPKLLRAAGHLRRMLETEAAFRPA